MSKPTWQFVAEATQGHLERLSREIAKGRQELSEFYGELGSLEDLPPTEYFAAYVRAAIRAGWCVTEGVTAESVSELSFKQARAYAKAVNEIFVDAVTVDPT